MEPLLVLLVAAHRARIAGTPLPYHSGHAVVADLCRRYQTRSYQGEDSQSHRTRRNIQEDRLLATAHRPLRAGRYLRQHSRWRRQGRTDGPPGVFIMDCETFAVLGRWEIDRGPQTLHYDFWGNLPRDYLVTSEWALPPQFENGIVPEDLLSNKYGHRIHFWDLRARRNVQTIDLGANHQMALEVRPAHDPVREYGFLGVVVDTTNLEGSIWTWWREGGKFHIEKTATIPPEPAPKEQLPPLLQGFGAVPPLVTDIDLSMDDKFLYVSCWGTGEMRQYDVSDPKKPKLAGSVRIGGIVRRTAHPNGKSYAGGPQMVEISRDGKRVYWTNSLYSTWDNQFYPEGMPGAMVMANANPNGGLELPKDYWVSFPEGYRAHQIRLEGGDCSTDSFCYPSV